MLKGSGIYKITNKQNKKFYVGSAKHFSKRWSVHCCLLKKGNHHSKKLQHAWNKYGEESFVFEIVERVPLKDLIEKEQFYIDNLNPDYNIVPTAHSQLGFKHSRESKEKMRKAKLGKKKSKEAVDKMTGPNNSRYGKPLEDWKIKKLKKERQGEGNPGAKLTKQQVLEMRSIFEEDPKVSQESLSIKYGVDKKTINNVVRRRTWKNV